MILTSVFTKNVQEAELSVVLPKSEQKFALEFSPNLSEKQYWTRYHESSKTAGQLMQPQHHAILNA